MDALARVQIAKSLIVAARALERRMGMVFASGEKYDGDNPEHRRALGQKLTEKLGEKGFKLSTERTRDHSRYGGQEQVWVFNHRKDPGLEIRVFTSVTPSGQARETGADAIRVCLSYKNKAKQANPDSTEAREYDLGGSCRVFRTGNIDDIVERTVDRAREAYIKANEVARCPKCKAPMAISQRTNKPFCSETCWLKNS
jgi:hypothetical protein